MSNTATVITTKAGEALIAQMQAENKVLVIDKFIFANVPNRPTFPDRDDIVPTEHVVHESTVNEQGSLTENSVIYSTTLASNVGPFSFNWSGLFCSEHNVLVAINFQPPVDKTVDAPGITGNTFVVSAEEKDDYTDAQGVNNFVCKIAQVFEDGSVGMLRKKDKIGHYVDSINNSHITRDAIESRPNLKVKTKDANQFILNEFATTNMLNRKYYAPIYIKNLAESSIEMNLLIKLVQNSGGGTIDLGDETYGVNPVIQQDDGYDTGWHVPYTPEQGQNQNRGIEFRLGSGCHVNATSNNMIALRASNNFTKITGTGVFDTPHKNVLHVGFVPDDMNQTTLGSQQFCSTDPDISFIGGYAAVTMQPAATVNGSDSGCFYITIGMNYYNVSYPVWLKEATHSDQNYTTTVFLQHIKGHLCRSSIKLDAGDAHMSHCAFEGMSGELIEYKEKAKPEYRLNNTLKVNDCDFEAYKSATMMSGWGLVLGANNKFVGGPSIVIDQIRSPNWTVGKVIHGSYSNVKVGIHTVEHVASDTSGNDVKLAKIIYGQDRKMVMYGSNLREITWNTPSTFAFSSTDCITLNAGESNAISKVDVKDRKYGTLFNGANSGAWSAGGAFLAGVDITRSYSSNILDFSDPTGKTIFKVSCNANVNVGGTLSGIQLGHGSQEYGSLLEPIATNRPHDGFGYGVYYGSGLSKGYKPFYAKDNNHNSMFVVAYDGSITNVTGTYGRISDKRTKQNIQPVRDYTDDFKRLNVCNYESKLIGNRKLLGLIADDVEKIFPSLVESDAEYKIDGKIIKDGKTLKESPLLFVAINVIQRLIDRVEVLEEKQKDNMESN